MGAHLEKYKDTPMGPLMLDLLKAYLLLAIIVWSASMIL
jgi:hypothetical protein